MPYITTWVDPEVFIEHNGVVVYHVYADDDIQQGARLYLFTLEKDAGEHDKKHVFDVRELKGWDDLVSKTPDYLSSTLCPDKGLLKRWGDAVQAFHRLVCECAIRNAIDSGELKKKE